MGNEAAVVALSSHIFLDWLDRKNRTALHWAIFFGHSEICKQLLLARACPTGTVGERSGRFLLTPMPCGVLPQRVAKHLESFVTPVQLALDRFSDDSHIVRLLTEWSNSTLNEQDSNGKCVQAVSCRKK